MNFLRPQRMDEAFEQRRKQFNIIWKIALVFIAFVILAVIAQFAFVGYVAYKAVPVIEQQGVKGVAEGIWYGKEGAR
jgi:hypothetical protein